MKYLIQIKQVRQISENFILIFMIFGSLFYSSTELAMKNEIKKKEGERYTKKI